ncbi:MAG: hypothetical protein LUG89_01405 [Methanosphaera sp.]|nr:hypothetical protein [Methanosphaera sp.]
MERNTKIVIAVVVVIILVFGSYIGYSAYADNKDKEEFNNTIKMASDLENTTDQNVVDFMENGSASTESAIVLYNSIIDNCTQEMNNLSYFKNNTRNDTYSEYLDLEVKRLENEIEMYNYQIKIAEAYRDYQNGDMSYSECLRIADDSADEKEILSDTVGDYKQDAIDLLKEHPDLNQTLVNLGIDEDFNENEMNGTGNSGDFYLY